MWLRLIYDVTEVINNDAFVNLIVKDSIDKIDLDEKKLYTKIIYGVVENKKMLDFLLRPYVNKGRFKPLIKNALRIGVYALTYLNLASFYVVNSLVDVIKNKNYRASKVINVILRSYISDNRYEKANLELDKLNELTKESIIYNIDEAVLKLIKKDYPNDYKEILKNETITFNTYRINLLKTTSSDVTNFLKQNGIEYTELNDAIITKQTLINTQLFTDAQVIPQDLSSMEVAKTLNPPPHSIVLDACSAPGTKAFHMATIMGNTGTIIACDIYSHKLGLIEKEAIRQGIKNIKTSLCDATQIDYQYMFKYILVDAPCSGMGTMKHKGDLKLRLTINRINEISKLQSEILNNVAKYLDYNGILVYSTCTINKDENERQIRLFLNNHPDIIMLEEKTYLPNNIQDGFYICKLQRKEA